jgi:hypothetical protein
MDLESLKKAQDAARGAMDQDGDFVTQASHAAWVAATAAYDAALAEIGA